MNLNLRAMLSGDLTLMRFVHRFSSFRVQHRESVAEHTFFTTIYSMLIADYVDDAGEVAVDIQMVLRKALIHDIEEARTGDILRMFKHRDEDVAEAISRAAAGEVFLMLDTLLPDGPVPSNMHDAYMMLWQDCKDDTIEGRIVKFADFLSVMSYLLQELESANHVLKQRTADFHNYLRMFDSPDFDFIRPLVDEAHAIARTELSYG